jgi:hypothetical protein
VLSTGAIERQPDIPDLRAMVITGKKENPGESPNQDERIPNSFARISSHRRVAAHRAAPSGDETGKENRLWKYAFI